MPEKFALVGTGMSDLDNYLDLVKDQNRTIATLRHMMERGYLITYLADRNQFGVNLRSGRYALCKYPTPKDQQEGVVLFDFYDDAYAKAQYLLWVDRDLKTNCGRVYELSELSSLIRRLITKE